MTLTTITRGYQSSSDYYAVNIGLPTTLVPGATTEMVGTQATAEQEQAQGELSAYQRQHPAPRP